MKNNFCSNCGEKLEDGQKNCPNCKKEITKLKEKNTSNLVLDIIRYIMASFLILIGIWGLIEEFWYAIISIICGFSLFPFIYRNFLNEYILNTKLLKVFQLVIPLLLFITLVIISFEENNIYIDTTKSNNLPSSERLIDKEEMFNRIVELMNIKLAFNYGNYVKGDIPAGEYAFIRYGPTYSYSEKDVDGDVIDSESFDSFGYVKVNETGNIYTGGILVNVKSFKQLGVNGAKEIYEILNNKSNTQNGMYKVGFDIKAGHYILKNIGTDGFYEILTGPVGGNNYIVDNNSKFNGKVRITLKKGQYLLVSNAKFID